MHSCWWFVRSLRDVRDDARCWLDDIVKTDKCIRSQEVRPLWLDLLERRWCAALGRVIQTVTETTIIAVVIVVQYCRQKMEHISETRFGKMSQNPSGWVVERRVVDLEKDKHPY